MVTLREMLEGEGFDWSSGIIVWHDHMEEADEDGLEYRWGSPGWGDLADGKKGVIINGSHWVLDHEFDSGYGGPECPRFIARDGHFIYFPAQYDGSTWVVKVSRDISDYIGEDPLPTPYPGG